MERYLARVILVVLHPLLITTLGVLLLFNSEFYLSVASSEMKMVILACAFLGTTILPLAAIAIHKILTAKKGPVPDRMLKTTYYLFTALCYYLSFQAISNVALAGFFKAGFLSGALVLVIMALITLRWPVSEYTTAAGALLGMVMALMLRLGSGAYGHLFGLIALGGLTGYAVLCLEKNNPAQVYAGYLLGFIVLFLIFSFIG